MSLRSSFSYRSALLLASLGVAAFALPGPGCADGAPTDAEAVGVVEAALIAPGDAHDVGLVAYRVLAATDLCDDPDATSLAEAEVPLEAEYLHGWVAPDDERGDTHRFADALFVLPPATYRVCVAPLTEDGEASSWCAPASAEVTVVANATTEVLLVSECDGTPQGGLDVVTVLNDPPEITSLAVTPSKFITQCETAALAAEATDPNGDALTWTWAVTTGPAGGAVAAGAPGAATFTPGAAGEYTLTVTVDDPYAGSVSLSFPIHVGPDDCGPPPSGTDWAGSYQGSMTVGLDLGGVPLPACQGSARLTVYEDGSAELSGGCAVGSVTMVLTGDGDVAGDALDGDVELSVHQGDTTLWEGGPYSWAGSFTSEEDVRIFNSGVTEFPGLLSFPALEGD